MIDKVRKNRGKVLAGAIAVLVIATMVVVTILGIGDRETSATASSGNASSGNIKKEKDSGSTKKKTEPLEEETTSSPEESITGEQETVMQVTVTSDETTVIQNPDGTTSTLNPGETLNIVKEVTNENGEKMYQLDNGGYVSAEKVSTPVTKPVSSSSVNSNSANNPQTDATTVSQEQPQTQAPTSKPAEVPTAAPVQPQTPVPTPKPTEAPTQAPTEAPTQPQNPWLTYEGYREEEIEIFKSKLVALRQSEIPKYGYLSEYATRYMNPQWNDTLYRIAKERAKEIAQDYPKNFDHVSAGNYLSGYNLGENIITCHYIQGGYAAEIFRNWCSSEGHYANLVSGGDQYAIAFYQKDGKVYGVFLAGDSNSYKVESYAAYYSEDWQEDGYASQQQAYNWLYNTFVQTYGTPIIR